MHTMFSLIDGIKARQVTDADIPLILEAERRLYPNEEPLHPSTIKHWYSKHPEFGMVFVDSSTGATVGNCITVALKKSGWEQLIQGKVAESGLCGDLLFDNATDDELAIHVYHLEKAQSYKKDWPQLGKVVMLQALAHVLHQFEEKRAASRGPLRVVGFSGLAVSPAGLHLFGTVFNCSEREYKCDECLMRQEDGQLVVLKGLDQAGMEAALAFGAQWVGRCRLLVLLPGETSIVWQVLKRWV